MSALLKASRRAVCDLPPDPVDVQRELQEIAVTHPELADKVHRASALLGKQSAFVLDIYRTLAGSRLVEHIE